MDGSERRRRELEAEAFGADTPAARRRDAIEALRQMEGRPPATGAASPDGEVPAARASARRRRGVLAGVAGGALVVGLVAGWAIGRAGPGSAVTSLPSASGDPAATSRLAAGDPAVPPTPTTATAQADLFLQSARTSSDELPQLVQTDGRIVASTSHLVATSAQGERLYAVRGSGRGGGYCLVTASDDHSFGGSTESVHCVSPARFERDGNSIVSAGYYATWAGGSVKVTVTAGSGG